MTEFNLSEWIKNEKVLEFIKHSDNFILERKQQFKILGSFYNHFLRHKIKNGM
jgi:tRNA (cmo5U34)-methyltransferase